MRMEWTTVMRCVPQLRRRAGMNQSHSTDDDAWDKRSLVNKEVVNQCMPLLEMIHGQCVQLGQRLTSMETLSAQLKGGWCAGDHVEYRRGGGHEREDRGDRGELQAVCGHAWLTGQGLRLNELTKVMAQLRQDCDASGTFSGGSGCAASTAAAAVAVGVSPGRELPKMTGQPENSSSTSGVRTVNTKRTRFRHRRSCRDCEESESCLMWTHRIHLIGKSAKRNREDSTKKTMINLWFAAQVTEDDTSKECTQFAQHCSQRRAKSKAGHQSRDRVAPEVSGDSKGSGTSWPSNTERRRFLLIVSGRNWKCGFSRRAWQRQERPRQSGGWWTSSLIENSRTGCFVTYRPVQKSHHGYPRSWFCRPVDVCLGLEEGFKRCTACTRRRRTAMLLCTI